MRKPMFVDMSLLPSNADLKRCHLISFFFFDTPFVLNFFFRPPVPRCNNTSSRAQSSCYLRIRAWRTQECGRSTCPKLTTLAFLPQILFAALAEQCPQAVRQKWSCSCCPCPSGSARSLFCQNTCQKSHNKIQAFEALRVGRQRFRSETTVWLWSEAFGFPARTLARPRLDHWNRLFARLCQRPSRLWCRTRSFAATKLPWASRTICFPVVWTTQQAAPCSFQRLLYGEPTLPAPQTSRRPCRGYSRSFDRQPWSPPYDRHTSVAEGRTPAAESAPTNFFPSPRFRPVRFR